MGAPQEGAPVTLQTASDTLSYVLGRLIGNSLMRSDSAMLRQELNRTIFFDAVEECLDGKPAQLNDQEGTRFLQQFKQAWIQKQQASVQQVGEEFLAANRKQPGVQNDL